MKWLADENFDNDILRGIRWRAVGFDVVRVQDLPEISGLDDSALLERATANGRTVLTRYISTMIPAVQGHLQRFASCPRVVLVPDSRPVGLLIDEMHRRNAAPRRGLD